MVISQSVLCGQLNAPQNAFLKMIVFSNIQIFRLIEDLPDN